MPSVEGVLVKMSMQLTAFQSTKCGVYLFIHKTELHKKYVGKSCNLCQDMVHLFHTVSLRNQRVSWWHVLMSPVYKRVLTS